MRQILINGSMHPVRQNCYDLLKACRRKTEPSLILWIDALCIDQRSTSEKNHQVAQMGKIFRQAHTVFVWLGRGDPDTGWLFRKLNSNLLSGHLQIERHQFESIDRIQKASTIIIKMEYWTRLWVIQELVMAEAITVLCGTRRLPWQSLVNHFRTANVLPGRGSLVDGPVLLLVEETRSQLSSENLELLFYKFGHMMCELPQDKIYALYGMQPESKLQSALVDYSQDSWTLLRELISQCRSAWPMEFVYALVTRLELKFRTWPAEILSQTLYVPLQKPAVFEYLCSRARTHDDRTWEKSCTCMAQSELFARKLSARGRLGKDIDVYASASSVPHVLQGFKISGSSEPGEYLLTHTLPSEDLLPFCPSASPVIGIGARDSMGLSSSCLDNDHRSFSECIMQLASTSVVRYNHKTKEHVLESDLSTFITLTLLLASRPRSENGGVTRGASWGTMYTQWVMRNRS